MDPLPFKQRPGRWCWGGGGAEILEGMFLASPEMRPPTKNCVEGKMRPIVKRGVGGLGTNTKTLGGNTFGGWVWDSCSSVHKSCFRHLGVPPIARPRMLQMQSFPLQ